MKGIILSILWFILFLAGTAAAMQAQKWGKPFKIFCTVFTVTLPLYILAYSLTPADFYVLPQFLVEPCSIVDFLYGLCTCAVLFHSFWDFVYAGPMGFSTGIMVDMERAGRKGMSTGELIESFSGEGDTDKIFRRRIPNLIQGGYVIVSEGGLYLTCKGRIIARATLFLKSLLCVGKGG